MAGEVTRPEAGVVLDRRTFLVASAAGAVLAGAGPGSAETTPVAESLFRSSEPLAGGWHVAKVFPVEAGALRLATEHQQSGRVRHVFVCRHEGAGSALATTGKVDLYLMNDGRNGSSLTPDDEVAMVESLAARLRGREDQIAGHGQLLANSERVHTYDPIDHADPLAPVANRPS